MNLNEFKYNFWLKSRKKSTYPKSLNSSCHINKQGNILLLHCSGPQKLVQIVINSQSFQIEQKITLNTDDCTNLDTTFLHKQSFYVNNRVYFIQNSIPKELNHIYCADFDLKKLFPIKNIDTKPSTFRINYSATLFQFKIYMFGGLNENNQPTNAFDTFDISTYKWEKVLTQGKVPAPRHSHCAEIVSEHLVIIGGTKSNDLFDRECFHSELHILDLNTLIWTQIPQDGAIPKYMSYGYSFKIDENSIIFLWNDRANDNYVIESSVLDFQTKKWNSLPILSQKPEHRYSAATCYNELTKQIIIFGGFSFTQNEMNCISNDLDQLSLFKEEDEELFSQLELYGGTKYLDQLEQAPPQLPEKIKDRFLDEDIEDISFEKLLEIEKKAEEEEKLKLNTSSSSSITENESQRENSKPKSKPKPQTQAAKKKKKPSKK
ncbi:kelch motif protein (macronuclear) [Tetrahymena thermophila SB210]|uniref:Kelch motif protein n=1 Tax=Tetrahymena thermophila (strain SB210) TaxID=312017 RepID=I7M659_TETTS|nr:kelch motif protein [Tetrahymena thermophila SB210]EAR84333.1 kelch motif protein [Tetrahymena thermophila SB210]|eukprot:XP_001031996.1 kelch motif protein [Tetrahymena thermophila SB210]